MRCIEQAAGRMRQEPVTMKRLSFSEVRRGYNSESTSYCNLVLHKIRAGGKTVSMAAHKRAPINERIPENTEWTLPRLESPYPQFKL